MIGKGTPAEGGKESEHQEDEPPVSDDDPDQAEKAADHQQGDPPQKLFEIL